MTHTIFGAIVLMLGSFLMIAQAEPAQAPFPKLPAKSLPAPEVDQRMPLFMTCAKAADDCARHCEICSAHCAKMLSEGKNEHLDTMRMCQDCAAVCVAMGRVAAKDGPVSDLLYPTCADVCKRCAELCDKHMGDPMMQQCAAECRKCEKACREMTKAKPEK